MRWTQLGATSLSCIGERNDTQDASRVTCQSYVLDLNSSSRNSQGK